MTELQKYLVEEIALDHADGLISRREALRRLALVGIGVSAATPLLAALAGQARAGGAPAPSKGTTKPGVAQATTPITFAGPGGRSLKGAWARRQRAARRGAGHPREPRPDRPHPSVAGRFAASGYSALAVDLLSEEGGTAAFTDPAAATGGAERRAAGPLRRRHEGRASTELQRRSPALKVGRDRLLLRRRDGVEAARRGGARARRGGAVLRAAAGGRGLYGLEGGRARGLRRAGLARQRRATRRGARCGGGAPARDRHVSRRRPRVLQRHRPPLQPALRPRLRTSACSPGSRGTSASPFARRRAGRRPDSAPQTSPGRPRSWRTVGAAARQREDVKRSVARVEAHERVGAEVAQPDARLGRRRRPRRPAASAPGSRHSRQRRSPGRSGRPGPRSTRSPRSGRASRTRRAARPGPRRRLDDGRRAGLDVDPRDVAAGE